MNKKLVLVSIFAVFVLVMLPVTSVAGSNVGQTTTAQNIGCKPPNETSRGGPFYNLLLRIIFWIGVILGLWPYA